LAIKSAYDRIRPDKIFFHTNYEPSGLFWELSKPFLTINQVTAPTEIFGNHINLIQHKADVLTLETILEYGGIALDLDVFVLKSFDEFLDYECSLPFQPDDNLKPFVFNKAIAIAVPNATFIKRWLADYKNFVADHWYKNSCLRPWELYQVFKKEVNLLDGAKFFWPLWTESGLNTLYNSAIYDYSNNYTIHLWESAPKANDYVKKLALSNCFYPKSTFETLASKIFFEPNDKFNYADLDLKLVTLTNSYIANPNIKEYLKNMSLIINYFNTNNVCKLQLGCGGNILEGWLNTDYYGNEENILPLDVTKSFSFPDNSFAYIFSEHLIEHLEYLEGLNMLKECFRILKPNGRIRISTPNLAFLIALYNEKKTDLQKSYIKWAVDNFLPHINIHDDTFVINNFFRNWGHKFIYDPKVLAYSLALAGFKNIELYNIHESNDDNLKNLESHGKHITEEYNKLESFVIEAVKI